MGVRRNWYVVIEWTDVFGERNETEIPCANRAHMEKVVAQTKNQFKHDSFVANFKVFGIYR